MDILNLEVVDTAEPVVFEENFEDLHELELKMEGYRTRLEKRETLTLDEDREITAFIALKRKRQFALVLAAKKKPKAEKETKSKEKVSLPAKRSKKETPLVNLEDLEF